MCLCVGGGVKERGGIDGGVWDRLGEIFIFWSFGGFILEMSFGCCSI